jgi:hypothetical protein
LPTQTRRAAKLIRGVENLIEIKDDLARDVIAAMELTRLINVRFWG